MGNYRFKLSDMIPNAWFYKLKDMSRGRKKYSSPSSSHLKRRPPTSSPVTSNSQKSTSSQRRYSYYITNQPIQRDKFSDSKSLSTQFPDLPRKSSSKRRSKRKTIYKPSPKPASPASNNIPDDGFGSNEKASSAYWNRANSIPTYSPDYSSSSLFESLSEPEDDHDHGFVIPESFDRQVSTWASSRKCRVSSSTSDIIIDMDEERELPFARKPDVRVKRFSSVDEFDLPPILTKPAKLASKKSTEPAKHHRSSSKLEETKSRGSLSVKIVEEERIRTRKEQATKTPSTSPVPARKSSSNSTGIRLRSNSPRIATRKHQPGTRRSVSSSRNGPVSESFVVVKSSLDPKQDFRDSMVEMIVENNIRASKDLEELLACYLSLNSNEYHDLIVKAFEDIWLDMTRLRL